MSKAKILIVEDESLIADFIAISLEELEYTITAVCNSFDQAMHSIKSDIPDLALLDINIKGNLDGIDLAHELNKLHIPFLFLTSRIDAKSVDRAKLVHPLGYITKPITKISLQTNLEVLTHNLLTNHKKEKSVAFGQNDFYFIKEKDTYIKLPFNSILYAEACDNYSIIYTLTNKYIVSQTLKSIEEKFSSHHFFRAHRSFLVNLAYVEKVLPKHLIIKAKEIPISEASKSELIKLIGTL